MTDVNDILSRAEREFAEYDRIKQEMAGAQARVNMLCREYSIATRRWGFQDYMLRRELNAWNGKKCA